VASASPPAASVTSSLKALMVLLASFCSLVSLACAACHVFSASAAGSRARSAVVCACSSNGSFNCAASTASDAVARNSSKPAVARTLKHACRRLQGRLRVWQRRKLPVLPPEGLRPATVAVAELTVAIVPTRLVVVCACLPNRELASKLAGFEMCASYCLLQPKHAWEGRNVHLSMQFWAIHACC
jgi:hypothetical protein